MDRISNNAINCGVHTCKHHNKNDAKCSRNSISISKDQVDDPSEVTHTACSNFEAHSEFK